MIWLAAAGVILILAWVVFLFTSPTQDDGKYSDNHDIHQLPDGRVVQVFNPDYLEYYFKDGYLVVLSPCELCPPQEVEIPQSKEGDIIRYTISCPNY